MKRWKTIKNKVVHKNNWFNITEDDIVLPNGKKGKYFVVHKPPASVVIPVENNRIYLVRQYRYPIKSFTWELPMGSHEDGESNLFLAKKELSEETGFIAKKWKYLGEFAWAAGIGDILGYVYLASGLKRGKQHLEETEQGMTIKAFSLFEIENMIAKNEIIDGGTISAIYKFKLLHK